MILSFPVGDTERRGKGRMETVCVWRGIVVQGSVIARVLIVLPRHSRPASPVYLSVPRAGDVIMWSDATWWPAGDSIVRCHGTIVHSVAVTGGRRPHGWWRWTRCPCSRPARWCLRAAESTVSVWPEPSVLRPGRATGVLHSTNWTELSSQSAQTLLCLP